MYSIEKEQHSVLTELAKTQQAIGILMRKPKAA